MQYKTPAAVITSAVVVAIIATPGIIMFYQIAFAAGGLGNPNSNVGGNGSPPIMSLKGGQTGQTNGQGICYGQGADLGTGNTQLPNGGPTLAHDQKTVRDTTCPPSPGAPSGH